MKECWRWFGPDDPCDLADLHQVGVTGIVTALHDSAPGTVWPLEAIKTRQGMVQAAGLQWSVVESLPVSETIKTQGSGYADHMAAYTQSLRHLAEAGIQTVCYNFMPILDWTRTALRQPQPHGGTAMAFDLIDFAAFDLFLLSRPGARDQFGDAVSAAAEERFASMNTAARVALQRTIVAGLPGANDGWTLDQVRERLAAYDGIDAARLRQNLIDFLGEVAPLADELGLRLCIHPDDPPYPLLGLPRIMSSLDDYALILDAVDLPSNGATLCTGSMGVAPEFDPVAFITRLGPRIHFAHLRNTTRVQDHGALCPSFFEALHLDGDTDMTATIRALQTEEQRRRDAGRSDWEIPMRPDHGQELLSDRGGHSLPGYPLIGRMRGLAELRGVMHATRPSAS